MKKVIIALVILLILAGGAFAFARRSDNTTPTTTTQPSNNSTNTNTASSEPSNNEESSAWTIKYDGNSFSPSTLIVKSGTKIAVVNDSDTDLEFQSDPHPAHGDNPELNVGKIPAGENKTFTVTTTGTFGFHNHLNSAQTGNITVQ